MLVNQNIVEVKNEFSYESKVNYTINTGIKRLIDHINKNPTITPNFHQENLFEINRNLFDDSIQAHINYNSIGTVSGYEKAVFKYNDIDLDFPSYSYERDKDGDFPNHLDWNLEDKSSSEIKFKNLRNISFGISYKAYEDEARRNNIGHVGYEATNALDWFLEKELPLSLFSTKTINKEQNNSANINEGDVLEFKTENSIKYRFNESGKIEKWEDIDNTVETYTIYTREATPEIEYNHTYLVPVDFNSYSINKTLFHVITYNDFDKPIDQDFNIRNGYMKTSTGNGETINLKFVKNEETDIKYLNDIKAYYLGDIVIDGFSSYDYENSKGILGLSNNAVNGEIIPYSLKGEYIREIHLGINSEFDDFTIYQKKNIERPLLDINNGIVKLSIDNNEIVEYMKSHYISSEVLKKIKNNEINLMFNELIG